MFTQVMRYRVYVLDSTEADWVALDGPRTADDIDRLIAAGHRVHYHAAP